MAKIKQRHIAFFLALLFLALVFSLAGTLWPQTHQAFSGGKILPRGDLIPWNKAREFFPLYSVAKVIDVESGQSFEVQRRGGTDHADVQTMTARDTEVLRSLYPLGWDWQRRAVVVEAGMATMAASINGMPHGGGKISGNEMKGHICLHFLGSKVHKNNKVDLAHQLMVYKAAGQPEQPFQQASPEEVIDLVFAAWNQRDVGLVGLGLSLSQDSDLWLMKKALDVELPDISLQKRIILPADQEGDGQTYTVKVSLTSPKGSRSIQEGILQVVRGSQGRWLLEAKSFIALIEGRQGSAPKTNP